MKKIILSLTLVIALIATLALPSGKALVMGEEETTVSGESWAEFDVGPGLALY